MGDRVAVVVVYGSDTIPDCRMKLASSLYVILLAMIFIPRSKEKICIIFCNSVSSLEALSGFKLEIDLV